MSGQAKQAEPRKPPTAEEVDKQWREWCAIEVAVRNPAVAESLRHWEERALKAETALARANEKDWKSVAFRLAEDRLTQGSYDWTPQELLDAVNAATEKDAVPEDIHSCSYYCERPECIKRQRDEMRDAQTADARQEPDCWALPAYGIAMSSGAVVYYGYTAEQMDTHGLACYRAAQCPHIRSSPDGTQHCALAQRHD